MNNKKIYKCKYCDWKGLLEEMERQIYNDDLPEWGIVYCCPECNQDIIFDFDFWKEESNE